MPSKAVTTSKRPAPKTKATDKTKKLNSRPRYSDMVRTAIINLKAKYGSSEPAILKFICAKYKVGDEKLARKHLKLALKAGIKNQSLKHSKGRGTPKLYSLDHTKPSQYAIQSKSVSLKKNKTSKNAKKLKSNVKTTIAEKRSSKQSSKSKKATKTTILKTTTESQKSKKVTTSKKRKRPSEKTVARQR